VQISLPLDKMSVQEKISTMETLWRKELLEAREGSNASDWNEAKDRIRQRTCK